MKVRVLCYEGYTGEETPRAFYLGERLVEVAEILDRWRGEWELTLFTRGTPLPPV